jgi:hypothetical protein
MVMEWCGRSLTGRRNTNFKPPVLGEIQAVGDTAAASRLRARARIILAAVTRASPSAGGITDNRDSGEAGAFDTPIGRLGVIDSRRGGPIRGKSVVCNERVSSHG